MSNKIKLLRTTDEANFLKKEFAAFKGIFVDYETYLKVLKEDVVKCTTCGIYYWNNCLTRCDCV